MAVKALEVFERQMRKKGLSDAETLGLRGGEPP